MQPGKFDNIFSGIGGFHLEKVINGCIGKYLEASGIESVLVENEIFGQGVVKTVMDGRNYIMSKRGMSLLAEAIEQLQMKAFLPKCEIALFGSLDEQIFQLHSLMEDHLGNQDQIYQCWNDCISEILSFDEKFNEFKEYGCEKSQMFLYWNMFISNIAPVCCDLTRYFWEANWELPMSAVSRAIPFCV